MYGSILAHPYSIAVDDRNLYWDDWSNDAIYVLHKSLQGLPKVLIGKTKGGSSLHRKFELKVYYKESEKGIYSIVSSKSFVYTSHYVRHYAVL